jgi:hypothetical protein
VFSHLQTLCVAPIQTNIRPVCVAPIQTNIRPDGTSRLCLVPSGPNWSRSGPSGSHTKKPYVVVCRDERQGQSPGAAP